MTARISNFARAPERILGTENGALCQQHRSYTETKVEQFDGGYLDVGCPACQWSALRLAPTDTEQYRQAQQVEQARKLNVLLIGSGITPRFQAATLDNYLTGGNARMTAALERCREFAENFPEHYQAGRSLLLVGNVGTGKTHLGSAIAQHVTEYAQAWIAQGNIKGGKGVEALMRDLFGCREPQPPKGAA
ncbi:hypothetical protein [Pseudomonas nitroreducens]|uniref:hypothetical protein n=1 Tax=Pseudomonas nitroreducens TaxID=46680 RepID=UPI002D7FF4A4|nr:hypothetical protein [Pseudomonas nitroreducens]